MKIHKNKKKIPQHKEIPENQYWKLRTKEKNSQQKQKLTAKEKTHNKSKISQQNKNFTRKAKTHNKVKYGIKQKSHCNMMRNKRL